MLDQHGTVRVKFTKPRSATNTKCRVENTPSDTKPNQKVQLTPYPGLDPHGTVRVKDTVKKIFTNLKHTQHIRKSITGY